MLTTTLGTVELPTCVFNASGVRCTTVEELNTLANNPYVGAVLTKSCTVKPRKGNPEPRYYDNQMTSINSNGLCNLGYKAYGSVQVSNKPYIVSVAGPSLNDALTIIRHFEAEDTSCDALELNPSCPNLSQNSGQLAYNKKNFREYLRRVTEAYTGMYGIKLPPYWFDYQFDNVTDILNDFKPTFVTCCNSLPNGLFIDSETETSCIRPRNGFGGIGGHAIKPIALANVRQFYSRFHGKIALIGCGGISCAKDAFEYILAGADAIQIGTKFMYSGDQVFREICDDLQTIMTGHDYKKLSDFRGQLKENKLINK